MRNRNFCKLLILLCYYELAGVAGFEPAHDEIKTRCLTAWRHPNKEPLSIQVVDQPQVKFSKNTRICIFAKKECRLR